MQRDIQLRNVTFDLFPTRSELIAFTCKRAGRNERQTAASFLRVNGIASQCPAKSLGIQLTLPMAGLCLSAERRGRDRES